MEVVETVAVSRRRKQSCRSPIAMRRMSTVLIAGEETHTMEKADSLGDIHMRTPDPSKMRGGDRHEEYRRPACKTAGGNSRRGSQQ